LYISESVFSLPHAIPYDRDETTIMKDKTGISPDEKLLGNKLPVTLNRGASGKIVNTILRAIKQKKQNSVNLIPTRSL
jgi:hypothetical protein